MSPRRASTKPKSANTDEAVASISYNAKRKNNPPSGLAAQGVLRDQPRLKYAYNPHLPPVLRISDDPAATDALPELLRAATERPLSEEEARTLALALRNHAPWLEWSGKREKPWFEVDPVALHIHERVSTQAILRVLAREDVQRSLFADPQQDYQSAVQFYKHDVDWANRMILGDSLQVMASLAHREDLAGKVQMIYFDPPYGIKFGSNFQPQLGQRDVKDRAQDLTREPEMVRAYRDTWTLGVHSYLAYLRDRLMLMKEMLTDCGSIFVQISDENLHRVRMLMDEVFGAENLVATIVFSKTSSATVNLLPNTADYILWYARDKVKARYRPIYYEKRVGSEDADKYDQIVEDSGYKRPISVVDIGQTLKTDYQVYRLDNITSQSIGREKGVGAACWFPVSISGQEFLPNERSRWKTNGEGMRRLLGADRVHVTGRTIAYVRYLRDFVVAPQTDVWTDIGGIQSRADPKIYVVQTSNEAIKRCMLMTTDPGDLVLDPTCGSGTTAFVAEQWGRRWITMDTSRVALALARQRLMTARFPMFKLRPLSAEDRERNPRGAWLRVSNEEAAAHALPAGEPLTFQCKSVPHITLKSIARNSTLDPIFAKHEPVLARCLQALNDALAQHVTPKLRTALATKLAAKEKQHGKRAVTDADRRRWLLPPDHRRGLKQDDYTVPLDFAGWYAWEVPFDTDPDWPTPLADALRAYRAAWRAKMDEVNACIAASAEVEELVDQPEPLPKVVRVAGPFTMEGVIALEDGPDREASPIGGAPDALDPGDWPDDNASTQHLALSTVNAEAHLDKMLRLLRAAGVDFKGNLNIKFDRLDLLPGNSTLLHAEGAWTRGSESKTVAVSIGPEVGSLSAMQVEEVIRIANRRGFDELVFAAFSFDPEAQSAIEDDANPRLRCHMALIRPDVAMDDLLKTQPGSQIFTVFSAPRVSGPTPVDDGLFTVEVEGMDIYNPVDNTLLGTDKKQIAAWFLDSDYDGRTFCICQAFFPDASKWDKLAKALGGGASGAGVIDESAFAALSGLRSLPFARPVRLKAGAPWRVAVKVIDPRGNEGLRVLTVTP